MSVTQTYVLAHTARAKLSREAARPEHNLRLLVGHANMLDGLMLDLADAEREQETWYNESVRHANTTSSSSSSPPPSPSPSKATPTRVRWADQVVESFDEEWDPDGDDSSDSSDSESDDDDSDYGQDDRFFVDITPTTAVSSAPLLNPTPRRLDNDVDSRDDHDDEDEFEDDLEEDYEDLALTRTNSRSHQPPDLLSDDEDDESSSEDDLSPPSPPQATFDHFSGSTGRSEEEQEIVASDFFPATNTTSSSSRPSSTGKAVVPEKPLLHEAAPPSQSPLLERPACLVSVGC